MKNQRKVNTDFTTRVAQNEFKSAARQPRAFNRAPARRFAQARILFADSAGLRETVASRKLILVRIYSFARRADVNKCFGSSKRERNHRRTTRETYRGILNGSKKEKKNPPSTPIVVPQRTITRFYISTGVYYL